MTTYEVYEKLLKERGLKSADVSKATGLSRAIISSWKNGKWEIKRDKVQLIADYFNVPISIFYGEETETTLSAEENKLLFLYNLVNEEGKQAILKYAKFISDDVTYSKKSLGYTDEAI